MSLGEKHHYSPGSGLRLKWGEIRTPTTTTTTPAPNKKVSFVDILNAIHESHQDISECDQVCSGRQGSLALPNQCCSSSFCSCPSSRYIGQRSNRQWQFFTTLSIRQLIFFHWIIRPWISFSHSDHLFARMAKRSALPRVSVSLRIGLSTSTVQCPLVWPMIYLGVQNLAVEVPEIQMGVWGLTTLAFKGQNSQLERVILITVTQPKMSKGEWSLTPITHTSLLAQH